jgi:hypothetical protein
VPSLLKLVCAFMLKGFPLDEAAQSELRREIELAAA